MTLITRTNLRNINVVVDRNAPTMKGEHERYCFRITNRCSGIRKELEECECEDELLPFT